MAESYSYNKTGSYSYRGNGSPTALCGTTVLTSAAASPRLLVDPSRLNRSNSVLTVNPAWCIAWYSSRISGGAPSALSCGEPVVGLPLLVTGPLIDMLGVDGAAAPGGSWFGASPLLVYTARFAPLEAVLLENGSALPLASPTWYACGSFSFPRAPRKAPRSFVSAVFVVAGDRPPTEGRPPASSP